MAVTLLHLVLAASAAVAFPLTAPVDAPPVSPIRLPDGGIQPQAAIDERGVIHVVYFTGTASSGDLMYSRLEGTQFSAAVRVNSIAGSAIATGSVRGAQLALGRGGRVHVAWNGSRALGESKRPQMWYARLDSSGGGFEAQRDVSIDADALDGGGSIAADRSGNVYVVWHARGEQQGEEYRTLYVAHSSDDGKTFAAARAVRNGTGACGCCGLRAHAARDGRVHILYRAATGGVQRDTTWLSFKSGAVASAKTLRLHPWELRQCPMSMFALAEDASGGIVAAWETEKQIFLSSLDAGRETFSTPVAMSGSGVRRLPSVAINASGARLVAWTEDTAWQRGGIVAWQLFDAACRPLGAARGVGEVPVWSLVAAVTRPDGSFVVIH